MEDIKISFEREMLSAHDLTDRELDMLQGELERLHARLSLPITARIKRQLVQDMESWAWHLGQRGRQVLLFIDVCPSSEPFTVYDAHCIVSEMNALREQLARDLPKLMRRDLEERLQAWIWELDDEEHDVRLTAHGYVLIGSEADYDEMLAQLLGHAEALASTLEV